MYIRHRLNDKYELQQRRHAGFMSEDERLVSVASAQLSRQRWYGAFPDLMGDGLIAAGHSMSARGTQARSNALIPTIR